MFRKTLFLIVAFLPSAALAGGYSSCGRTYSTPTRSYVSHDSYSRDYYQRDYAQNIVENQNIFYSVGQDVRQYAVTPQAVALAQYGQIQRQITGLADQLSTYREQATYAPQQQIMCVPVYYPPQGQAAQIAAGVQQAIPGYAPQPAQQPNGYAPQPQPQPQQPQQPPNTFSQQMPPNTQRLQSNGIVDARCMKCHGANGKARNEFDLTRVLSCEDRLKAMRAVMAGEMPKGDKLNADEIGKFIEEMIGQPNVQQTQPTQQQQQQQPTPQQQPPVGAAAVMQQFSGLRQ